MKISKPAFHKAGFLLLKHFAFARFYSAGYAVFIHGDIHVGRVFREIFAEPHFYRAAARERNVGWRIDYFVVSDRLRGNIKDAYILPEVMGSDHCPVGLDIIW